jgi:large subunit ribosomal protein L13
VDASGQTLGRLATRVANILSGKDSPRYTPFIDAGDHVIVINADKVRVTGMKANAKVYHRYTGYPGGLRSEEFTKRMQRKPEQVVQEAIQGMLPKSKMGKAMAKKLKVYRGDKHPHSAQMPKAVGA